MPLRLAVVLSHPTQYYSPWFRWIAARASDAVTLRVFYLWDFGVTRQRDPKFGQSFQWDVDLLSGYDHEFVPNTSHDPGTHHFRGLQNPDLTTRLAAWRPDAVLLFGYNWSAHIRAIAWARRRRLPLLFRGDSHFLGRGAPPFLKRLLLRALYAQFGAFLSVGSANRDYFRQLRIPERKIFPSPHAVDHTLFDATRPDHVDATAGLREQLGLTTATRVVLFAGKLVAEKQPYELIEAFAAVNIPNTALVFVGNGAEKERLVARARELPNLTIRFLPFSNQSEMPSRMLLADVFALPSRGHYETWGLAVNEAMHMGVPALVSDVVGCQQDLVTEGETGWVSRAAEPNGLEAALRRALEAVSRPAERERLRGNALARIANYTYTQTTTGLVTALRAIPVCAR